MKLILFEKVNEYKFLKDNKELLSGEEREIAMKAKAVWHPSNLPTPTCAIWKAKDKSGKTWYLCNTHRAYAKEPTLEKAIKKFHSFIKGTA